MSCNRKWIILNDNILESYNASPYIKCRYCDKFKFVFFVHENFGDYYCYKCDKEGFIRYVCFNCSKGKWKLSEIEKI